MKTRTVEPCTGRAVAAAALLSLALCGSAAAEPWKCYTFIPVATDPTFLAHTALAEDVTAKSEARVEMTCHLGGSLPIKSNTIVQAVSDNVIQFASANPNAFETFVPFAGVLSLPGLFSNDEELEKGVAVAAPYVEKALADKNVLLLAWMHFPQAAVFGTDVVKSVKDMEGKKYRVSTPEQSELLRRLGVTPVVISSPEVSSALNTGVIQGVLTSNSGGGRAWKDLFKSTYRLGTNYTPFVFIVNKSAYEALSDADRQMLDKAVAEKAAAITADLLSSDAELTKEFEAGGMVVTVPAGDEATVVERTMKDYWDQWASEKGGDAQQVLADIRKALGK